MKLKKILAAVMSAAMAVSAMALSSLTVSAADSLENIPAGAEKEEVLYTLDMTGKKTSFTSAWENGDWMQLDLTDKSIMTSSDVYVKVVMTGLGTVSTGEGAKTLEDIIPWGWDNYKWAQAFKWYNNTADGTFECFFIPSVTSTSDNAVAYAPIASLALNQYGSIAGNFQSCQFSAVTVSSVQIVKIAGSSTTPSESEKEPEEDTEKEPEEVKPIAINPSAPPADAISAKVFKVKLVNEGSKAKKVRVIAANDIITIRLDKANDGKYANIYVDDDCLDSVLIKYGRAKTKALDTEKFTVTITDKPVIEEAAE